MIDPFSLWLPILLAAVFVFVASSVIHMVLPIHRGDYTKLTNEQQVLASLRQHGLQAGQYMFPCASSMKDMGTPEMLEKFKQGPVGTLIVRPAGVPMIGKSLVQWFLFTVLVGFCVAYIAGLSIARGAEGMLVFRITGAVALLPYAVCYVHDSIWKGLRWGTSFRFVLDGIVYALVTGAAFALCWPAAA